MDPWIPSVFPPLISHRFILLLSIVVSILFCFICGWKINKQLFFIYYLIINVLSFYISVYHYLWINLRLTEILLLVKNLHLGLHYFNHNIICFSLHLSLSLSLSLINSIIILVVLCVFFFFFWSIYSKLFLLDFVNN